MDQSVGEIDQTVSSESENCKHRWDNTSSIKQAILNWKFLVINSHEKQHNVSDPCHNFRQTEQCNECFFKPRLCLRYDFWYSNQYKHDQPTTEKRERIIYLQSAYRGLLCLPISVNTGRACFFISLTSSTWLYALSAVKWRCIDKPSWAFAQALGIKEDWILALRIAWIASSLLVLVATHTWVFAVEIYLDTFFYDI